MCTYLGMCTYLQNRPRYTYLIHKFIKFRGCVEAARKRTNVPLSSASTWTPFHHPLYLWLQKFYHVLRDIFNKVIFRYGKCGNIFKQLEKCSLNLPDKWFFWKFKSVFVVKIPLTYYVFFMHLMLKYMLPLHKSFYVHCNMSLAAIC